MAGINAFSEPLAPTVLVDVCAPGMLCLDARCQWPAQVAIKREERSPSHYCGDHYEERCKRHREQGQEITYTDAAREYLTGIDRPVIT